MTINITQSNLVGFPGLSQNNPADPLVQTILPSIYEYGSTFSIDVNFAYVPTGEEDPYIDIELDYISVTTNLSATSTLTVQQVGPKVLRISGRAIDIFTDAFYQFIMPDNSLKILPPTTSEFFLALVRYSPPGLKRKTVTHTINYDVTYTPNPSDPLATEVTINNTTAFTQDVVWNYNIAVQQFNTVLAKGVI
jgi:hypothetical protein